MIRLPIALVSALLLSGCAAVPPPAADGAVVIPRPSDGAAVTPPPPDSAAPCPVIRSSDWKAWINAMPGPGARPTLIVTGQVTVPSGGYRFPWRDLQVLESHPIQLVAELQPIAPAGGVTAAVLTYDVRGEWPTTPPVGSVTVRCGGRVLARISPVETAH